MMLGMCDWIFSIMVPVGCSIAMAFSRRRPDQQLGAGDATDT